MLDKNFWNDRYINNQTGWDLGEVSPPIKLWADNFEKKNAKILIPGCGNAYEAEYLLNMGFQNITLIDIAPEIVTILKKRFENEKKINIICDDFFDLNESFDLVIEQTFFCALNPELRVNYVKKMSDLLNKNGLLVGLLFNRYFESGPPFGGSKEDYQALFRKAFKINKMEICLNSIKPREGSELWVELEKI